MNHITPLPILIIAKDTPFVKYIMRDFQTTKKKDKNPLVSKNTKTLVKQGL